jgi:hypothetical protein
MALETGTSRPGRPRRPTLEGRPPTVSLSLSNGKHGGQLGQLHFHFCFHHSTTPPPRLSPVGLRARALKLKLSARTLRVRPASQLAARPCCSFQGPGQLPPNQASSLREHRPLQDSRYPPAKELREEVGSLFCCSLTNSRGRKGLAMLLLLTAG